MSNISTYCRLCLTAYKLNNKGKIADAPLKLFKHRDDGKSHAERLKNHGIIVDENLTKSSTICKRCERSIKVSTR